MKIAHFAIFAPHACGQYETVKDLILAERQAGIDARFIDYGFENKPESRTGLKDGIIETQPLAWAKEDADIGFFHSSAPPDLNISLVCALHGRPENSFRLEYFKLNPVISFLQAAAKKKKFQAYVTFWPEYTFYWSRLLPGEKIYHVPAPVNFDLFSPDGPKHDFGTFAGEPNIVIADMWREDYTPFNLVFAAQYFKEHFYPKAKLHIYGVPRDNTSVNFLSSFKKMGLMGEIWGIVPFLDEIYRSADMVITPNIIATRIIRESLASGTPVVAPRGCSLTEFKGEPRDIKDFATAMKQCWESKPTREDVRQFAYQQFNPEKIGNEIKKVCERVINQKKPLWNGMSIRPKDWSVIKQVVKGLLIKRNRYGTTCPSGLKTGVLLSRCLTCGAWKT